MQAQETTRSANLLKLLQQICDSYLLTPFSQLVMPRSVGSESGSDMEIETNFFCNDSYPAQITERVVQEVTEYVYNAATPEQTVKLITLILAVMEKYLHDSWIQIVSCNIISRIAEHRDTYRIEIGKQGGVETILRVMPQHKDSRDVLYHACAALGFLALADVNQTSIALFGGIDMIISVIRDNTERDDPAVITKASFALRKIAFNMDNKKYIFDKGGIQVMLKAMKKHMQNSEFVQQAILVLGNVSYNDEYTSRPICELGCVDLIVEAMRYHENDKLVQQQACSALFNFSNEGGDRILECGAIDLIFDAIEKYKDDSVFEFEALSVLGNLCYNEDCQDEIIEKHGMELYIAKIRQYMDKPFFLEEALFAFHYFSFSHVLSIRMMKLGVIELIFEMIDCHIMHDSLLQQACYVLANIALDRDIQLEICRVGGLEKLAEALEYYRDVPELNKYIIHIFSNISSFHAPDRLKITEEGDLEREIANRFTPDSTAQHILSALVERTAVDAQIHKHVVNAQANFESRSLLVPDFLHLLEPSQQRTSDLCLRAGGK